MNKKIFAILIVLICALSISAVSAADDSAATDVAAIDDPVVGTFDDLKTDLNGQTSVVLEKNYTNTGDEDAIVLNSVVIDGNNTIIDANDSSSIFKIAPGATVTINNLTFIKGNSTLGAAIINQGTLNLINCSFKDNTLQGIGGIIYNDGVLNIENCTFEGTPGVFNELGKTATINGTTVDVITNTTVSVNPIADAVYGDVITVKGTISPDNITGAKVTVKVNDEAEVEANIVNDTYSYVLDKLAAGEYNVTVTYVPGTGYQNSVATTKFNVTKNETTITLTGNKTQFNYPEDVVINVTTNLPKDAKVNVTVYDKEGKIVDTQNVTIGEDGTVQATIAGLEAGNYDINATFDGNENYTAAKELIYLYVHMVKTDMNITANATVNVGEKVTIKGSTAKMPTDAKVNVTVYDKEGNIVSTQNVTLTDGNFSVDVAKLPVGNYTVVANYTGDNNYISSEATANVEVTIITTDMNIAASDVVYGNVVDITGITSGIPDDAEVNITITKDGVEVYNKTVTVTSNAFTDSVANLAVGNYTIVATYKGDENHTAISNETTVEVTPIETEISITVSDIQVGDDLTVSGTTTNIPEDANVTIKVTAEDGTVVNETIVQVDSSNAFTATIKDLVAGKYNVTANYAGTENYTAAADNATVTVSKKPTSINTLTAADVNVGTNVTVSGTTTGIPEGANVTLSINNVEVGKATVNSNAFTTDLELAAGNYTIVATYEDATGEYETATKNVTVIVSKYGVTITPEADKIKQANETNVTIKGQIAIDPVDSTVLAELENKTVTISIAGRDDVTGKIDADGKFEAKLGNFTTDGVYNATIKFDATDKFDAANATVIITIGKHPVTIVITNIEGTVGENVTVNGTVDVSVGNIADVAGQNVTIVIGDKEINATIEADGKFSANVGNFTTADVLAYTVKFNGTENYTAATASAQIYVKAPTNITISNVTVQVGETVIIKGTITGNATGKVVISIEGREDVLAPIDAQGKFSLEVPAFTEGNKDYAFNVTYSGSTLCFESQANGTITVYKNETTIDISNVTIVYGNNVTINGTALELAGENVTVTVEGTEYNATVANDGKFSVVVETDALDAGEYAYTVAFKGNALYNATTVNAKINITKRNVTISIDKINGIDSEDIIVNGTTSPLLKDETVDVYVDNVKKGSGTVDENGTFSVNIGTIEGGKYNYTVVIDPAKNINKVNASEKLIILNTTTMAADNVSAKVGDDINVTITTTGFENNTEITITVNGVEQTVKVVDGEINLPLGEATKDGVTDYTVEFAGNEYYSASQANFTVNVTKYDTSIDVNDETIDFGENVNITITTVNMTNGTSITVSINGQDQTVEVNNNTAVVKLTKPAAGVYNITVTYAGDNKYAASNATATLTVNKAVTAIEANSTVTKIDVGDDLIVSGNTTNVANNSDITITVVDGDKTQTFTTKVVDNKFSMNIGNATSEGTAKVTVSFAGNQNYTACNDTYDLTVGRDTPTFNVDVNATDVLNNVTINGTALDKEGNPLANENITIVFQGNTTNTTTDSNGKFSVDLGKLPVGEYTADVTFDGNDDYRDATNVVKFNVTLVKTNITVEDATVTAGSNFTVNGTVTNIPENKTIVVEIDGVKKEVNVTADGKFSAEFETLPGNKNYTINVSFAGDDTYGPASANGTLTVNKVNTTISIGNFTFFVDEVNVTVNGTTTGIPDNATVTINIGKGNRVVNVTDGKFSLKVTNMPPAGEYNITVSYAGDDYYNEATNSSKLIVNRYPTNTTVSVDSIIEAGENLTVNATITTANGDNITSGKATLVIDGKEIETKDVVNGTVSFVVEKLKTGNKTVTVKYLGTDFYAPSENTTKALVNGTASELSAPAIIKYYKNGTQLLIYLTSKGENVTGETVGITINGRTYYRNIINGTAVMEINLNPGVYNVTVSFESNIYNPATVNTTVTVLSTIEGNDTTLYYRNGTKFVGLFLDGQGNPLPNSKISFNINGKIYQRTTDANGTASLNIELRQGSYIITAQAANGEKKSFNIVVLPTIISNDVVKYYRNGTQYSVTVVDGHGNGVAGQKVSFNINGKIYQRTTDANGTATLTIDLRAGNSVPTEYVITATWGDAQVSNTITVLPVIAADDFDVTVKPTPFYATVLDGQGNAQSGVQVSFNINGKIYIKTSGDDGRAALNISLLKGDYIITSTRLDNNAQISNKIRVLA